MARKTLGKRVCEWIEAYCVIPDGPDIGKPFTIPPFWRQTIFEWYELVTDGAGGWRRRYSQGLIGVPKKNLKTSMAAAMALYELAGSEDPAALVISAASTEDQGSNLLFGSARTMVNQSPHLKDALTAMTSEITVPEQPRARMKNITSKAGSQDGINARAIFCDELHEWIGPRGRALFEVLEGALTSRADATLLAITTAGYDEDSICYERYQHGKRVLSGDAEDPRFYFKWIASPSGSDYRDPKVWAGCNPLLGITVHESVLADRVIRDRESVFRRYHLNQWVAGEDIWIAEAAWDACKDTTLDLDPAKPLHVGIDVGIRHDSTAVSMAQRQQDADGVIRTVVRAKVWENPYARDHSLHDAWMLDIEQIEDFLIDLRERFPEPATTVDDEIMPGPEFAYDPAFFERSAQLLQSGTRVKDGAVSEFPPLTMVEFPQSDSRMIPASQTLFDLVTETGIAHDGDLTLRRHILSATADEKGRGAWRLSKPKGSTRKIDAAVALAIAVHRAQQQEPEEEESVYATRGILLI